MDRGSISAGDGFGESASARLSASARHGAARSNRGAGFTSRTYLRERLFFAGSWKGGNDDAAKARIL